ncbi:type II toxin-antitoxin system mRNA interferase toxin, RelE/StbE family [Candidatus Falkowbacteria bacterium]|nr:type II toxin-antitoxin system mRNA interferase toxin, RelE/StbE family [Candidatus Falkowbacteria bacterium]
MYSLKYSSHFKKDLKKFKEDKPVIAELENVLNLLASGKKLPEKYRNHSLTGEFKHS